MRTLFILVIFNLSLPAFAEHLSTFSCSSSQTLPNENSYSATWASAEHFYLGDLAIKNACTELNVPAAFCPSKFQRYDKKLSYTYGEMAALGDFYKSGDHMFEETGSDNISSGGMEKIFQCMDKEGKVMHEQREHPEVNFPDCTWVFLVNSKKYLFLAEDNFDHFSWGAVKAYIRDHTQALQLAQQSYELRKQGKVEAADYYFRRAVFANSVADHYLMDLFSAGHVDVPRQQIRQFAQGNLSGPFKKFVGDALAIILHSNNSRNEQMQEVGLQVSNPRGDAWWTHSDGHMMVCSTDVDPVIQMPTLAIQQSLKDLYDVLLDGKTVDEYKALDFIPRANMQMLSAKYKFILSSNDSQKRKLIDQLKDSLPLPLRIITSNKSVEAMLRKLSVIIQQYQLQINSDVTSNESLKKRMSPAVQAFWLLN